MDRIKKIYEDEDLLVIDKPAGVIVNKAVSTRGKLTVQGWLEKNFDWPVFKKKVFRQGIVHRLDKDTSGLLILAKNAKALKNMQSSFKKRQVKKEYLSLVHGHLKPKKGKVTAPVTRNPFNKQRFGVFVGGKPAETSYQVVEYYLRDKKQYSLISLKPKTGRTHQLRVHLKYLGYPIVADKWYGGRKQHKKDLKWCENLFLQAIKLEFKQPVTKKELSLKIKLSQDKKAVLKSLKKIDMGF